MTPPSSSFQAGHPTVDAAHAALTLCDAAEQEGTILEVRRVRAAILRAPNDEPDAMTITGTVTQQ